MNEKGQAIFRTTIICLAIGILLSFKLWISDRAFPLIPVVEFFPWPEQLTYALLGLFVVVFVVPIRAIIIIVFSLLLLLALQDQMRWQPWFYHYLLFILPFCLRAQRFNLNYFRLIIVGIYFWGGVNKLNPMFIDQVFPRFIQEIAGWDIASFKALGYAVPLLEISIAIGLLWGGVRRWAVYAGCIMHLLILVYLSPIGSGSNSIVIPWNIAMMAFLFLCFQTSKNISPFKGFWENATSKVELLVIVLFLSLPVMSFWQKWDYYLSFNLYSGKNEIFYIAVEETVTHKLVFDFEASLVQLEGLEGGALIDVNKWSFKELNVPVPPEKRIFKAIAHDFCKLDIPEDKIMFLEIEKPVNNENIRSYTCATLR